MDEMPDIEITCMIIFKYVDNSIWDESNDIITAYLRGYVDIIAS